MWLDALVNYLTVLGYPAQEAKGVSETTHIIGKDIAKFHCIYYPLFLRGAGLNLPSRVLSHGHWLQDSKKMSKSLGNVTDPFELLRDFGQASVRAYFLSEGPQTDDVNFQKFKLTNTHNDFLANGYLNLFQRVTGKKISSSLPGELTYSNDTLFDEAINQVDVLSNEVWAHMDSLNFVEALAKIKKIVSIANSLLAHYEIWKLVGGSQEEVRRLQDLVYLAFEVTRISSLLMMPVCPDLAR